MTGRIRTSTRKGRERVVAAYGLRIASAVSFRVTHRGAEGDGDLRFTMVDEAPLARGWERTPPSFDNALPGQYSDMANRVVRVDDCVVTRFGDAAGLHLGRPDPVPAA